MLVTLIVFLLILSILVLIHEAGHYFAAKKFGIKVEEFGFGFPLTKPIWQKKRGETVYSLYPALIGGFVKLYGEDEAGAGRLDVKHPHAQVKKEDEKRAFFAKPLWQRTIVIVAGVAMNTLLAVFVYYIFLAMSDYKTQLPVIGTRPPVVGANEIYLPQGVPVGAVAKNSPAEKAGMEPPVLITSVNDRNVKSLDAFIKTINENKGKEVRIEWVDPRTGNTQKATITPRVSPPKDEGALGVALGDYIPYSSILVSYESPVQKLFSGFSHTLNLTIDNVYGLGALISQSVQEKTAEPLSKNVGGPVLIGKVVGDVLQIENIKARVMQLLNLMGLLSISLAFLNVLPIPGLDGGRLLFIGIEAVTGRKVNPRVEAAFHSIGIAILLALMVVITFKDITQFFK